MYPVGIWALVPSDWVQRRGPEYISKNNKVKQGETAESEKSGVLPTVDGLTGER